MKGINRGCVFACILGAALLCGCGQNEAETETGKVNVDYQIDINEDGSQEKITLLSGEEENTYTLQVENEDGVFYDQKLYVHESLGSMLLIVDIDGKSYLMNYYPMVDHDVASCSYEIFNFDKDGTKQKYTSNSIEISLFDVKDMDTDKWNEFAEEENRFLENAILVFDGTEGNLTYSTSEKVISYKENFDWLSVEDNKDADSIDNLNKFVSEYESYSE